jgi:hypothetical protein
MAATQFHCPHCGALYEKTDTRVAARDNDRVACVVCRHSMYDAKNHGDAAFKLIKRPESDTE